LWQTNPTIKIAIYKLGRDIFQFSGVNIDFDNFYWINREAFSYRNPAKSI